jgi:hypothetical protein
MQTARLADRLCNFADDIARAEERTDADVTVVEAAAQSMLETACHHVTIGRYSLVESLYNDSVE